MKKILLLLALLLVPVNAETIEIEFRKIDIIDLQVSGIPQVKESCSTINGYAISQTYWEEYRAQMEKVQAYTEATDERITYEEYNEAVESGHKVVNFDNYWDTVYATDVGADNRQSYLDRDYILVDMIDYFHHNTDLFESLFYSINPGDTVIIGGKSWTANYLAYGYIGPMMLDEGDIYVQHDTIMENGYDVWWSQTSTEIITCTDANGGRAIWHLS